MEAQEWFDKEGMDIPYPKTDVHVYFRYELSGDVMYPSET